MTAATQPAKVRGRAGAAQRGELVVGDRVQVRGRTWVVGAVDAGEHTTCVTLQSVEDGEYGRTLDVIWEVEVDRRILPAGSLPEITAEGFDAPTRLAAFLDAVRWSAVTSAETRTLQAPFRSGVAIEDYQLEPVARAVGAPRVNLLLADDVGLGKTIEAGLVAQELLLRNRARRIMIVCPAGLTVKWRDEMAEKFGLDFTVIDSERCAQVRRDFGSGANPFNVFPLAIVSLPWLRGPKAQRLLSEVLPPDGQPTLPRTFDLLILDEAHHVAPAAPNQVYAVDSQQTRLVRGLAPHFTHRLFLSATPHNGYQASFTALLEILDDQRFARGVEPDPDAVRQVVVRRLKSDIVRADGSPRFVRRRTSPIAVDYPDDEREVHRVLAEFTALRRARATKRRGRKAVDLVTLLLKKRLFSSPRAFGRTCEAYLETVRRKAGRTTPNQADEEFLDEFLDLDDELYDDEALLQAEDDALDRAIPLQSEEQDGTDREIALLEEMARWADRHDAQADAKATELIRYLEAVCKPDRHWTNERVVVFTEYRDTQIWLADLLRQRGMDAPHVALLHGGVHGDDREQLRLAFQADPTEHPVRILLATDAASEGIDLQRHCHRLVNYDIPFNPNRLEQRIGRVDRYGQEHEPDIRHFVGTGWKTAADTFENDLEFLARVASKVVTMKADLGSVNAVLADAVQRRMVGEHVAIDVEAADSGPGPELPVDKDVRRQVKALQDTVSATVEALGITPAAVHRVVSTALDLARQQPLRPFEDERSLADGLWTVPPLTSSWERAAAGLTEKLERKDQTPRQRPVTFDPAVAAGRDDVVLAHLNHPLVAMSTRLLRAAVSNPEIELHRVAAVVSDDPRLEDVLVGAYSRFVLVGADGIRLHEEVLHSGGWSPEQGRFRRWDNVGEFGALLSRALADGTPAAPHVRQRLAERWPRIREGLVAAVDARAKTRQASLERVLGERRDEEQRRIVERLDHFADTLRGALQVDEETAQQELFSKVEAAKTKDELAQYKKDRRSWADKLAGIELQKKRELEVIADRYAEPTPHVFPVAVVFVVPRREAVR
ncbi:DISARM system SNF2-like helicase DrmD [Pseudonocardia lutea]|uniref:DISARM system SNF2-like helicase DrmD n=1 Tax=Pseudonocardia lutea TaxID=2172015 RepID=A0ABW1I1R6_9PSEU